MDHRHLALGLCLLLVACGTSAAAPYATPLPLIGTPADDLAPTPPVRGQFLATPISPTRAALPSPTSVASVTPLPSLTPTPTLAPTAAQPATSAGPVQLQIAAIDLDRPLVSVGLDAQRVPIVPNHDVGWYNLSARPGEGENIVLWGHVLRFMSAPDTPAPFARINELVVGDEVILRDAAGQTWRYRVARQIWATPDQVGYILPQGREMLTMVSCIGAKVVVDSEIEMSHRLITIADPVG